MDIEFLNSQQSKFGRVVQAVNLDIVPCEGSNPTMNKIFGNFRLFRVPCK